MKLCIHLAISTFNFQLLSQIRCKLWVASRHGRAGIKAAMPLPSEVWWCMGKVWDRTTGVRAPSFLHCSDSLCHVTGRASADTTYTHTSSSRWTVHDQHDHKNTGILSETSTHTCTHTHTRTHTRLTALFPGLPGWANTRKVKPVWISLKQETVSGSGISWPVCKFAPRSRQTTMPAPHHYQRPASITNTTICY